MAVSQWNLVIAQDVDYQSGIDPDDVYIAKSFLLFSWRNECKQFITGTRVVTLLQFILLLFFHCYQMQTALIRQVT